MSLSARAFSLALPEAEDPRSIKRDKRIERQLVARITELEKELEEMKARQRRRAEKDRADKRPERVLRARITELETEADVLHTALVEGDAHREAAQRFSRELVWLSKI